MLSGPRALASASEAAEYMLHEYLVRNDKAHRTANRWHGGGAEALGLPQRVSRRRFVAVLEGHVPGTNIRLGRVVGGEHQHRPGWDCTFSAPKSVSLEALLHDNRAVMRAHDASVRAALDWMEAEFLQTRSYEPETGRRPRVKAEGLVAATFRHVASRNNDPQLHTHAVIANMTRNAAGEWRSVEPTQLQRNRRLIGAWYRNDLARRLGEKAGSMSRFMPFECARRVAGFQRSAQSARNAGANVRTVGTAAGARFACVSPISTRAACRASSTVSASSAPSVLLTTEPLQRRCTIHVLRPFGRARSPSPGAALSHSTASRPSAGAKARAPAMVIFVLFLMVRSLPFVSVATGAAQVPPLGNTQDTPGNGAGLEDGKVGSAALKRRAGSKPLLRLGLQRFADALAGCDFLRPSAL